MMVTGLKPRAILHLTSLREAGTRIDAFPFLVIIRSIHKSDLHPSSMRLTCIDLNLSMRTKVHNLLKGGKRLLLVKGHRHQP